MGVVRRTGGMVEFVERPASEYDFSLTDEELKKIIKAYKRAGNRKFAKEIEEKYGKKPEKKSWIQKIIDFFKGG